MKESGQEIEVVAEATGAALLVEEFRARHAEILHYLQEAKQIVFWSLAASAAVWAWVVENKCRTEAQALLNFIIFVPLLVSVYCGLRWLLLDHYVDENATYVKKHIDKFLPTTGWETYLWEKYIHKNEPKDDTEKQVNFLQRYNKYMAVTLWLLLVASNLAGIVINFSTRCENLI